MLSLDAISAAFAGLQPWGQAVVYGLLSVLNLGVIFAIFAYLRRNPGLRRPARPRPRQPLDTLLDDLADALLGIDAEDRIVYLNRRVEALFGFSRAELMERNYQTLLFLAGDFAAGEARKLTDGGQAIGIEHDAFGLRRDGSRFPARVTVTPRRRGRIRALVAIREAPPASDPDDGAGALPGFPDGVDLLSSARRIRRFATLLDQKGGSASRLDQELLRALREATEDMYSTLNYSANRLPSADAGSPSDLQPVLLGRWLEDHSRAHHEEARHRGSRLRLQVATAPDLVIMVDEDRLALILEALLDFTLKAYGSSSVELHLTHGDAPTADPPPGRPRLPDGLAGTGAERSVSLLVIARSPLPGPTAFNAVSGDLQERVLADPRIRLAAELVPAVGGGFSLEANGSGSLLFQISLACTAYTDAGERPGPPGLNGNGREGTLDGTLQAVPPPDGGAIVLCAVASPDLRQWLDDTLSPQGFRLIPATPEEVIDRLHDDGQADLLILEDGMEAERDFDLTFEVRQFRSEQELPVLLLRPATARTPPVRRHSYQASLSFPGDSSELLRTASRLCGRHPAPADP